MSLRLRMPFKSFEYSEIEFNNYIYEESTKLIYWQFRQHLSCKHVNIKKQDILKYAKDNPWATQQQVVGHFSTFSEILAMCIKER